MLDTEHGYCSINIVDISETDYNDYMDFLEEGFSVFSEEIKRGLFLYNPTEKRLSEDIEGQD